MDLFDSVAWLILPNIADCRDLATHTLVHRMRRDTPETGVMIVELLLWVRFWWRDCGSKAIRILQSWNVICGVRHLEAC